MRTAGMAGMSEAKNSQASRLCAGVTGIGVAFGVPVIVGLCLTVTGPAAADVTNKQSFTAAQAASSPSNVVSFRGARTPSAWRSRIPPDVSAAVRTGAVAGVTASRRPGPAPAGLTADRVPHNLTADRWSGPAPARVTADRWSGPAPAGLTADRVPHSLMADRSSGPAPDARARPAAPAAAAAVAPAAAGAPTSAAARVAMLAPASTAVADRSATKELLKSAATVKGLRKARQAAASHRR
jgi:hypothetical protein